MKIFIAGFERIYGTSKAGTSFDMCNVHALVPVQAVNNGKITIAGSGHKVMDIPLAAEAMPQLAPYASKMPCWVDVITDARPMSGKLETIIVGVEPAAKAA